jgi:peroxiredoxin
MQVGEVAPDVNIFNLDGKQIQISETSGKKKLILFWASWSPH